MARKSQNLRDKKGRYIKLTVMIKLKRLCNKIMGAIENWIKRAEQ